MSFSVERVILFLATGAFSGYSPFAPGTVGTLVGICIFLILPPVPPLFSIMILLLLFFLSVFLSYKAEKILQEKDSEHIVIDEIFGFLVTMAFLPCEVFYIVLGFFLFRLFDITKIFPANLVESKFRNGYGVVMDDFVAGIYANLILQCVRFLKA